MPRLGFPFPLGKVRPFHFRSLHPYQIRVTLQISLLLSRLAPHLCLLQSLRTDPHTGSYYRPVFLKLSYRKLKSWQVLKSSTQFGLYSPGHNSSLSLISMVEAFSLCICATSKCSSRLSSTILAISVTDS